jgi:hypothetical protein
VSHQYGGAKVTPIGFDLQTVTDSRVVEVVGRAQHRVALAVPALSSTLGRALTEAAERLGPNQVHLLVDVEAEPLRSGYADPEGLMILKQIVCGRRIHVQAQPGLRLGLLVADDNLLIWAPTPLMIEGERGALEPNAIRIGTSLTSPGHTHASEAAALLSAKDVERRTACTVEQIQATSREIESNPPMPIDLTRKYRVFSSRFQYVEAEVKGIRWNQKVLSLDDLKLNADLPDVVAQSIESTLLPFAHSNPHFPVQVTVGGQLAFDADGRPLCRDVTQADLETEWREIKKRYLHPISGFGSIIDRGQLDQFKKEARGFESRLQCWAKQFVEDVQKQEEARIEEFEQAILHRWERLPEKQRPNVDLRRRLVEALGNMLAEEPAVTIVMKDIAWDSVRDEAFTSQLRRALPKEQYAEWFKEFDVVGAKT